MTKKIVFIILVFISFYNYCFSSVMGPIEIYIIGFDNNSNSLYFTLTNWGECDCPTELYIYKIDSDSIETIKNWSSKYDFSKKRNEIIKEKGLSYLEKIDTTLIPDFVRLDWNTPIKYYSKVLLSETTSYPFTITIFNEEYKYYQCNKNKGNPEIINYQINDKYGFILLTYQGDCFEGNLRDTIIFYKVGNENISRKLVINDIVPIDVYKMERP